MPRETQHGSGTN